MFGRKLGKLEKTMANASSYAEWQVAARAHDEHSGAQRWKNMDQSRRYDYISVRIRLDRIRALRARQDNVGLLFTLNEGIHGNMGGMGNAKLYGRAKFGTKKLVTEYVTEINDALNYLASPQVNDISLEDKLDFFNRASHCYGRTALMMSGSGSLLYFHVGVVKALWEESLLPAVLSGSSGGGVIAAIAGTHPPDELASMFDPAFLLNEVKKEVNVWDRLSSLRPRALAPDRLREVLERLVPDLTFQEAAQKTGMQINISVAPAETQQTSRLLNAIASPNVYIHDALMATTAVPGVYPPVMLMAKNVRGERQPHMESLKWVDGAVSDDLPAKRLARLYGVNHYIVSQTNPLVLPFINDGTAAQGPLGAYRKALGSTGQAFFNASLESLKRPLSYSPMLERIATMSRSVINQRYTGDINIIPDYRMVDPRKLLALRSEAEVMDLIRAGERAAWKRLEMVRVQSMISRSLDRIVPELEQALQRPVSNSVRHKHNRVAAAAS